jgi:hypothetical protein
MFELYTLEDVHGCLFRTRKWAPPLAFTGEIDEGLRALMNKVYGLMSFGL